MTREKNDQVTRALSEYMTEHGVQRVDIARHIDRSPAYVGERLSGKRHLSLDILIGAAELSHVSTEALMIELVARMRPAR